MQRRITGHKRDKVTGGWRKWHNDKCHNLYSSPNIIIIKLRMMSWTGHAVHGAMKNAYKTHIRWGDDIKRILRKQYGRV
jgi:hypothetical protein